MEQRILDRLDVERMLTAADVVMRYAAGPETLRGRGALISWRTRDGLRLYPEVQFTGDGPVPVIDDVARYLGMDAASEELCTWFYTPRATLRGEAPIDLLHENPDAVRALALQEGPRDRRGHVRLMALASPASCSTM